MKPPSKKVKAIVSAVAVVGVAVLVGAGFALKRPILERWYLWELDSEDDEQRKLAAQKLGELESVKAVPKLLQVLRDYQQPNTDAQFKRISLFPDAPRNIPQVSHLVLFEMTEEYWTDFWPGRTIAAIGSRGIPHVAEGIKDEGWLFGHTLDGSPISLEDPPSGGPVQVRMNSVMDAGLRKAIEKMGPAAAPYLVEMLLDENPNTRRLAVLTLGAVAKGFDDPKIISALVGALNDANFRIRCLSAWAIGEISPVTENALSALRAAESDEHEWVRVAAAEALKKIQGESRPSSRTGI
jgi:HEAT repeat protein